MVADSLLQWDDSIEFVLVTINLSASQDVIHVIKTKVKVKGLGRNSLFLAGFSIFFHGSMKKFNQLAEKKLLKIFLSSIKTTVAIKFPKKIFLSAKIQMALKELKI